jgi:hypothetical protein
MIKTLTLAFLSLVTTGIFAETPEEIVKEIYSYKIQEVQEMPSSIPLEIEASEIELNDKAPKEIMARLLHPYFCGTRGCLTYILVKEKSKWREISPNLITHGDLEITTEIFNGYNSIKFGENKTWHYNGIKYE